MSEQDTRVREALVRAAEHYQVDTETALGAVKNERQIGQRVTSGARPLLRSGLGLVVALTVSAALIAGGLSLAHRTQVRRTHQRLGSSPDASFVDKWGGALAWEGSGGGNQLSVTTASGAQEFTLGFDVPADTVISPGKPAGSLLVTVGPRALLILKSGGQQITVSGATSIAGVPSWSSDGVSFAFEDCSVEVSCFVKTASSTDGSSTNPLVGSSGRGVSWSPDGKRIAYFDRNDVLSLYDPNTGSSAPLITPKAVVAASGELSALGGTRAFLILPQWSPSGAFIATVVQVGTPDGTNYFAPVVITSDGSVVGVGSLAKLGPPALAWRRGADQLVYAEGPRSGGFDVSEVSLLSIMRAPTWVSTPLVSMSGQPVYGVFSSPDGSVALFQTLDEVAAGSQGHGPPPMIWNVVNLESGAVVETDHTQQQVLDWR